MLLMAWLSECLKNKFDNSGKNFLMFANWPNGKFEKDSNTDQVEKIINIILIKLVNWI